MVLSSSHQHKMTTMNKFIDGLHYNFTLKWGCQRRLIWCTKNVITTINDDAAASIKMPESTMTQKRKLEPEKDQSSSEASLMLHNLTEMKEKLIHDLRASVDRMIDAIPEREKRLESLPTVMAALTVDAAGKGNRLKVDERKHSGSDKKEIRKICVPLSKKEIEEDLMKMVVRWPRQRPKRKPKALRMKLDVCYRLH